MGTNHSIIPPSSAARRMACPGSRKLEALVPQQNNEASLEGTLAHAIAASLLKRDESNETNDLYAQDGVTSEMIEHAVAYEEYVNNIEKSLGVLSVEERSSHPLIHPESFGTPDAVISNGSHIHIIDFKYGFVPVDAKENWQLLTYASAYFAKDRTYYLHIYQPRDYISGRIVKTWEIDSYQLLGYIARLQKSEELAMTDEAPLMTGAHCGNCRAKAICPALQFASAKAVEISKESSPREQFPHEAAQELTILQEASRILEARINGLESVVFESLKNGASIPQFILKTSYGREHWKIPTQEAILLGDMYGCDIRKEPEVITPKQAIKAGIPEDVVRGYTETHNKLKLERNK